MASVTLGGHTAVIDLWDARARFVAAYRECGGLPNDASGIDAVAYSRALVGACQELGFPTVSAGAAQALSEKVMTVVAEEEKKSPWRGTPSSPASTGPAPSP